ncbi:MAG: hypothetical protein JJ992_01175 [Planctomycetes bacterium]|nr:hypothetical protein [Planctomycetota bacterium]
MRTVDPEILKLQNEIYRSRVLRARQMTIGERVADGFRLFRWGMKIMRGGIRAQYPAFTEEQVEAEVARRMRIGRKLSEGDIYRDAGILDE